MFMSQIEKGEL